MTRKIATIGAVLLLSLAFADCHKKASDEEGSSAEPVPDVTVAKVERAAVSQDLTVSGNLAALPNRDAKVAAQAPGRIARVLVVEGDQVRDGQELAEVDATLLREQERQAAAAVAQARANVENAKLAEAREEGLLSKGVSSRKEVEDARTQLTVNTALLHQAQAAYESARSQVTRAIVRAPFAGTVVKRFVGAGEQVDGTAAQPVVEVAQIETLELLGAVPAARLAELKTHQVFAFETTNVPEAKFNAIVAAILPAVDPATNNGTVRIRIQNAKHELKLGQFLSINLPVQESGARLVVPKQAVYPDESGAPHVYVVNGGEAQSVAVELGVQTKDKAEITSGVKEGQTVIVTGGYGLPEKSKVHVKQ